MPSIIKRKLLKKNLFITNNKLDGTSQDYSLHSTKIPDIPKGNFSKNEILLTVLVLLGKKITTDRR